MTRLDLLELDEIPAEYHYLFTDDYLGDRHIFRVWAHGTSGTSTSTSPVTIHPDTSHATVSFADWPGEILLPGNQQQVC